MNPCHDSALFESGCQLIPGHAEAVGHPDRELMEDVFAVGTNNGNRQPFNSGQLAGKEGRITDAPVVELIQLPHLADAACCGNVRHPVVETQGLMEVLLALAMTSQQPALPGDIGAVGGDHPTFASGDVLGGVEGEAANSERPHFPSAVLRAMGLAGVFNQRQVVFVAYSRDLVHFTWLAIEVDDDDCLCALGHRLLQKARADVEGLLVNISEHGLGTAEQDGVGGGNKAEGSGDDLVAVPYPGCQQGEVESCGSTVQCHGVLGADVVRKQLFKPGNLRTLDQHARPEDIGYGLNLVIAQRRIRDRQHIVHPPRAASMTWTACLSFSVLSSYPQFPRR
jgi:hypothetical protein